MSVRGRAIGQVIVAVCCLALGGVFVRASEVGPIATGGYRSLIAAPMLFVLHARMRGRGSAVPIPRRDQALVAVGGLMLATDLCLWNVSFLYTTLAESNLLANLVPFIVALYGWILYRSRPNRLLVVPSAMAICGLAMLALANTSLAPSHMVGDGLALATAFFYAGFLVVAKGLRERYPAMQIMAILSVWCGGACFAVAILRGERLVPQTIHGWLLLVGLAITSQVLGQTLMAHAVRFLPLQLASLFVLLQPVAAAIYAFAFFSEELSLVQIGGVAVILASIYWAKIILEPEPVK